MTHIGYPYFTHNNVLYFYPIFVIIFITYSILFHDLVFIYFIRHLFITLLVPHKCFSCFLNIALFKIVLYFMYT